LRRQILVESALRAHLETIGSPAERQRALDEIRACAHVHLWRVLDRSWSPRGMWHALLGYIVIRRMDSMIDRLRHDLDLPQEQPVDRPFMPPGPTQRAQT
jgi:hypothetical protein